MVKIVRTNALAVNRTADTLLARIRSVKDVPDLEGNHNLLREFLYRIWFVHASPPMELLHDPSLPEDQNELLKIMCGYMMRYPEVRVGFPDVVRLVEGEEFHWFGGNSDKLRLGINLSMVWSNKAIELIQMAREHVEKRKTSRS